MTTVITQEQGYTGLSLKIPRVLTQSTLAQVTTAGWWNNYYVSSGQPPLHPQDLVCICYSYGNASLQATALFSVSISNGVVTLSLAEANVVLPTIANHIATYTNTLGTLGEDPATAISGGNIQAGLSGTAGTLASYPATAAKGSLILKGVANTGNTNTTISNAAMGQASVISIPDPGAATANFLLDAGTNDAGTFTALTATTANITNLKYGATPVPQVDPGSCTITAAAGASNTCTITIQLKDGSGTNMSRTIPFKVYLATDATGLTLQSAASTGYSVASGGVKDPTGSTTITQGLSAFSSATGGCVISLLDTGKGTGNLILMLPNGFKASAAVTSGSYG
jgi:hypothetical protein